MSNAARVGRLGGCFWLAFAGLGLLFAAGAAGVGIGGSSLLVVAVAIPLALALLVFLAGDRSPVAAVSLAAGVAYAALSVWSSIRAEALERANPGTVDIGGGFAAVVAVVLGLAVAAWSLGAIALERRDRPRRGAGRGHPRCNRGGGDGGGGGRRRWP